MMRIWSGLINTRSISVRMISRRVDQSADSRCDATDSVKLSRQANASRKEDCSRETVSDSVSCAFNFDNRFVELVGADLFVLTNTLAAEAMGIAPGATTAQATARSTW